jgi:hypothetical protein
VKLGEGLGNSKKNAKLMAARDAVEQLIAGVRFDLDGIAVTAAAAGAVNSEYFFLFV